MESLRSQFEPNQIVAASLFTTLSATAWLEKARDLLASTSPASSLSAPKSVFKFSEITSITSQQQSKSAPSQFTAIPLNLAYMQGVGRIAFGSFRSPNFLNDQMVIPATPTGGADVVLPAELKEIPFVVFLPDRPAPPGGYPAVILGHGSDMFDMQIGNAFAEGMAAYGLAVIAINMVGHGGGPASYATLKDAAGNTTTVPYPGRTVDMDGNGTYDSGEGCKLFTGPLAVGVRDCYRQAAIDFLQLTRMIKGGVDLDGDGGVDLDPARVYFSGISLGAGLGTLFTALSPDIPAVALIAGGA